HRGDAIAAVALGDLGHNGVEVIGIDWRVVVVGCCGRDAFKLLCECRDLGLKVAHLTLKRFGRVGDHRTVLLSRQLFEFFESHRCALTRGSLPPERSSCSSAAISWRSVMSLLYCRQIISGSSGIWRRWRRASR